MRTSEQTGTKPQARKARSDAAFPGATWAQHHSPGGIAARPARINRRPSPRPPAAGLISSTDSSPTIDQATTEDHEPDLVAVDLDVPAVVGGTLNPRMVVEVVAPFESLAIATGRDEHDVQGSDLELRTGDGAKDVGLRGAAEAVRTECGQLGWVDVSQHVGMAGERDDRPCARRVGRQHLHATVGGRERLTRRPLEDAAQRMLGHCMGIWASSPRSVTRVPRGGSPRTPIAARLAGARSVGTSELASLAQPSTRSRYGLANVRSGSIRSRVSANTSHWGYRPFSVDARCPCSLPQCGRPS